MSLANILSKVVQKILDEPRVKEIFQSFEGVSVTLKLRGDKTVTFTVKNGKPVVVEGEVQNATAIAEVDAKEFCRFIDGREHFGGLFKIDFEKYFRTCKGEFYDFGGDFMLLGPICNELNRLYGEDQEFRDFIEKYKGEKL